MVLVAQIFGHRIKTVGLATLNGLIRVNGRVVAEPLHPSVVSITDDDTIETLHNTRPYVSVSTGSTAGEGSGPWQQGEASDLGLRLRERSHLPDGRQRPSERTLADVL